MKETVINAWYAGMAIEEISDEFGYDESKVMAILEEEGLLGD